MTLVRLLELKYEEAKDRLVKSSPDQLAINQARALVFEELHSALTKPTPQLNTKTEG